MAGLVESVSSGKLAQMIGSKGSSIVKSVSEAVDAGKTKVATMYQGIKQGVSGFVTGARESIPEGILKVLRKLDTLKQQGLDLIPDSVKQVTGNYAKDNLTFLGLMEEKLENEIQSTVREVVDGPAPDLFPRPFDMVGMKKKAADAREKAQKAVDRVEAVRAELAALERERTQAGQARVGRVKDWKRREAKLTEELIVAEAKENRDLETLGEILGAIGGAVMEEKQKKSRQSAPSVRPAPRSGGGGHPPSCRCGRSGCGK